MIEKDSQKGIRPILEMFKSLAIALVVVLIIRTFLVSPVWIPSSSMVPTLRINDRVMVNKLYLRYSEVERGDLLVFRYPKNEDVVLVKRIIALPGETLEIKQDGIYVDGERIEEPYLVEDYRYEPLGPILVPEDSYFALGDNRNHSKDSRDWGNVPEDNLIGKAFFVYWPLTNLGPVE